MSGAGDTMDRDMDACFQAADEVARKAGEMIKAAFSQEKRIELKASIADLVTETDQQVEKMVISTLSSKFPSHKFIGEESVAAGEKCNLTDDPTWIIDPIDGTTNFVHRFPYTAISIGLLVNKKTEVAIIYNPILDEMYTARPGKGAYCNGRKLQVTTTKELGQSLICTEFGSSRDPGKLDAKQKTMRNIIEKAHGIRSVGSAAISMCLVASGNVDAYAEAGIHCWDIAAGDLIVREAGGVVFDLGGGPLDLMNRRVLCAGTEQLAQQLAKEIVHIDFEKD